MSVLATPIATTSSVFALAMSVAVAASLGCRVGQTQVPSHDELVTDHMQGRYAEVLRWCPEIVEDIGADPAQSDWCLFGYPAATWLSRDREAALAFMRNVCTDLAGSPRGDASFRIFYVGEVARWYALPLRMQNRDKALERVLRATIEQLSAVCFVDPEEVERGLDTKLPTRREAR